jgi:hypothetical protein
VVDFPTGVPVLIIDGGLRAGEAPGGDGYFLTSAMLQPGRVPTGLRPQVEPPRFLDDHPLDQFGVVYLCNVVRLTVAATDKLKKYVEAGGGLAIFVGDRSSANFLNGLYDGGKGLFPAPVEAPVPLLVDQSRKTPDIQVTANPVFRMPDSMFLKLANIGKYMAVKKNWKPPEGSGVQVIARVRNSAPLVIEKKYGAGRVVAFLTTAAPNWNNWAQSAPGASFVTTILDLQNYLLTGAQTDPTQLVGEPLQITADPQKYSEQVEFLTPQEGTADRVVVKAEPRDDGPPTATFTGTDYSGIYEIQRTARDNTPELTAVAFNVEASEGNLKTLDHEQLKSEFPDLVFDYHLAGDSFFDAKEVQGRNLSEIILYGLVFLLIGEQLLAYSASYHPARLQGARG